MTERLRRARRAVHRTRIKTAPKDKAATRDTTPPMSLVGQNPLLPRRNIDGGFTSINGHYLATYLRCRRDCLAVMEWRRSRRRMGEGLPRPVHVSMRHREPCGHCAR